ncbi:MAG: cytochrome c-type biogenesis protein CcmH [Chloroflexi bacterium]|nr:MAG: cytochrome c-type biogenesis protein CcmH [Chloroflexota bacterium]
MKQKSQQQRWLLLVLALTLVVAVTWLALLIHASTHRTLDQRVYEVASQLKCPVCQYESVADSPSSLAQNMRLVIRQQLQAGKSEQEVIQYFINSYGNQIVWLPPQQGFTLLAWIMPLVLLCGGVIVLFFVGRDWQKAELSLDYVTLHAREVQGLATLTEHDQARYRALIEAELAADDVLFVPHRRDAQ